MVGKGFLFAVRGALVLALLFVAATARAGGGPENLFLVVNAASWASQTVANHFIELRQIPPLNVFYLDWGGGFESVEGDELRQRILLPVLEAIDKRGLLNQIDYIIYSSDFPYSVDLSKDFIGVRVSEQSRPGCSLNSATYLWHLLLNKNPHVMDFHVNDYMREAEDRKPEVATRGFRSWYGWGRQGEVIEAGGQPFMLSTMLAMTSGRGNSVPEAVAYLRASAAADGTHPKGTVYYTKTDDVRSKTRAPLFEPAIDALKKLGVRAELTSDAMPVGKDDVQGLMSGVADFNWSKLRSKILPGAICENFTSYGGVLAEGSSQTPLTEFLRHGAAGSSGTIIEPFAIADKFPSPFLQVHYARGCTLAEAYYQSVYAPAQLLIVGDPLCRPWANIPQVQVSGVKAGATVSGTVVLQPEAKLPRGGKIDHYELFVDGRRMGSTRDGQSLSWDSTNDCDGYHDLRVVAVEASPIETQGRAMIPVTVNNHKRTAELAITPAKTARWDEPLKLRAKITGATEIFVMHNTKLIVKIAGDEGEAQVNPRLLGLGPVDLYAMALLPGGGLVNRVVSAPVRLTVEPSKPMPALKDAPKNLVRGLVMKMPDGKVVPIQETRDPAWLTLLGLQAFEPYLLQGFFEIAKEDVYQFQLWHYGDVKLSIDGHVLYNEPKGNNSEKFLPVVLAAGTHRLTVVGKAADDLKLRILFGGPGSQSINGTTFRHPR